MQPVVSKGEFQIYSHYANTEFIFVKLNYMKDSVEGL